MQGLSKTRTELPEMLVFDILAKLPVKSLIRLKCVCKHWSSSFQSPLFITQHHHNHLRNNNLNFILKCSIGKSSSYCNLFELSTEDGQSFSLKQNIRLPNLKVTLPFETKQVDLYSLKGNSWKEISSPGVTAWGRAWFDNHVNGICYWPAYGSNSDDFCCILSFDMVNERFSTLSLPEFHGGFVEYEPLLLNINGLLFFRVSGHPTLSGMVCVSNQYLFRMVSVLIQPVLLSWEDTMVEIWVMSGSWPS
ncbi:hypothetical protein GQ457_03G024350 [Hibiscus cannabinus]